MNPNEKILLEDVLKVHLTQMIVEQIDEEIFRFMKNPKKVMDPELFWDMRNKLYLSYCDEIAQTISGMVIDLKHTFSDVGDYPIKVRKFGKRI